MKARPCVGRPTRAMREGRAPRWALYGCEYTPPSDDADHVTDVRRGFLADDDAGWRRWAIVPLDESAGEEWDEAAIERAGFYAFMGGPGRPFAAEPSARRYGRKVLVVQWGGLDV